MPNRCTVLRWVRDDHDGFRARYDIAVDLRAQELADQMLEIASTPVIGEKVKQLDGKPTERTTGDMVQRSRLHVDALKWTLARLAPKRFGDRISQEISGPNGGPIQTEVQDAAMAEFEAVKTFVTDLREKIEDPVLRSQIIASLPGRGREDAETIERIAAARAGIVAERSSGEEDSTGTSC